MGDVATGSPAVVEPSGLLRPETLRPYFSIGLPFIALLFKKLRALSPHIPCVRKVFLFGAKSGA
jgi:hypothetical protein